MKAGDRSFKAVFSWAASGSATGVAEAAAAALAHSDSWRSKFLSSVNFSPRELSTCKQSTGAFPARKPDFKCSSKVSLNKMSCTGK